MRLITIASDGIAPSILQQSVWAGYDNDTQFVQLIHDLKTFIESVEKKLSSINLQPEIKFTQQDELEKIDNQINQLLDQRNQLKKLSEEPRN